MKTSNVCYASLGNSLGQWYYVAATYDAAAGAQTIYVDGGAVQTVSQPAGNTVVPLTGYNNMYIGYSNTNSGYFDGLIDDVKVFDRPLTAEEISQEYQNGDLMAHWALDEKQSATTAYDDTLRGNNGTNNAASINQTGASQQRLRFQRLDQLRIRSLHEL